MADFSMELNEDQIQIQKWVHDFAENVVRPAAHEWDEKEEMPWPIIEEAAEIGMERDVSETERGHHGQRPVDTGDPAVLFALPCHQKVKTDAIHPNHRDQQQEELRERPQVPPAGRKMFQQ